jgi:septal ring factor EnvC (AmiA/AmiB activator)
MTISRTEADDDPGKEVRRLEGIINQLSAKQSALQKERERKTSALQTELAKLRSEVKDKLKKISALEGQISEIETHMDQALVERDRKIADAKDHLKQQLLKVASPGAVSTKPQTPCGCCGSSVRVDKLSKHIERVHGTGISVAQKKDAGRSEVVWMVAKVSAKEPKKLPIGEVNTKGRSTKARRRREPATREPRGLADIPRSLGIIRVRGRRRQSI